MKKSKNPLGNISQKSAMVLMQLVCVKIKSDSVHRHFAHVNSSEEVTKCVYSGTVFKYPFMLFCTSAFQKQRLNLNSIAFISKL